ncbi:MAG: hypothetical protein U0S48_11085 [Solirubrobacteraceae bacterium]
MAASKPRRPALHLGKYGNPWKDVPGVQDRLRREGMLRDPMDPEKRAAEVRELAERFGLPL